MAMGFASLGMCEDGNGRDLHSLPVLAEGRRKSKEMKALVSSQSTPSSSWFFLRSLLIMASSAPIPDRQVALSSQQWVDLFSPDGKLRDKAKLLNRVRWGGIEPGIRAEVWPFLLGVLDWDSTEIERNESRMQRREEYQKLRERCLQLPKAGSGNDLDHSEHSCSDATFSPKIYAIWRRIIRLDAIRVEKIPCPGSHILISESAAWDYANAVGLKDYDYLDAYQLLHAVRLVALLEAYVIYDPEIGYCQGMADLLSPIATVIEDDAEAFWCFVAFMRHARHNFRLDEAGIWRQLRVVARIIRRQDAAFFRHLQQQQAADCAFAYRMVVVLLRRELSFEQTMNLWEVLWAEQAAVQAGTGRRRHIVQRQQPCEAPPAEDLLLYVVVACVLQLREVIMVENFSVEEIQGQCNAMAGNVDLWKMLDEARRLVLSLHGKVRNASISRGRIM
ncbi:rab GTPase-activating protein 22-like isoform X2 [Wolffia australiana]